MKKIESLLSEKPSWTLFSLHEFYFYMQNFLYENVIKQTADPAEKSIPMAGSCIWRCHHPGQLLPLLISTMNFFIPNADGKMAPDFVFRHTPSRGNQLNQT